MPNAEQRFPDLYAAMDRALDSDEVRRVMQEYAGNMGFALEGLPEYGLRKVARYAMIVCYCELNGLTTDEFRMSPREITEAQMRLADAATRAGKTVIVTDGETTQVSEPEERHA